MTTMKFHVHNGRVSGFKDEIEKYFPEVVIERQQRVSRIVPYNRTLRAIFILLRRLVEDDSTIAEWTRHWKCQWIVHVDGETLGPMKDRASAIRAEKRYIQETIYHREIHKLLKHTPRRQTLEPLHHEPD